MPRASFPLAFALFISLGMVGLAFAQNDGKIHLPPTISQSPSMGNIPVRSADDALKEQMKKANELRLEEIKRDTEKLFQLSSELKDFVVKTNQGVLSLDALKKAEQIEKLAHSVKSKMKLAY
jgi:transposase